MFLAVLFCLPFVALISAHPIFDFYGGGYGGDDFYGDPFGIEAIRTRSWPSNRFDFGRRDTFDFSGIGSEYYARDYPGVVDVSSRDYVREFAPEFIHKENVVVRPPYRTSYSRFLNAYENRFPIRRYDPFVC